MAADDIFKTRYSLFYESLFNVVVHILRRRTVKRQVTALGADYQFIARKASCLGEITQSSSNRAFASLKAIVRSSVYDVRAQFNGAHNRVRVSPIGSLIRISQVGANANRRRPELLLLAEMTFRCVGEAIAIPSSAFVASV